MVYTTKQQRLQPCESSNSTMSWDPKQRKPLYDDRNTEAASRPCGLRLWNARACGPSYKKCCELWIQARCPSCAATWMRHDDDHALGPHEAIKTRPMNKSVQACDALTSIELRTLVAVVCVPLKWTMDLRRFPQVFEPAARWGFATCIISPSLCQSTMDARKHFPQTYEQHRAGLATDQAHLASDGCHRISMRHHHKTS